jgi:hypothetical protein
MPALRCSVCKNALCGRVAAHPHLARAWPIFAQHSPTNRASSIRGCCPLFISAFQMSANTSKSVELLVLPNMPFC